MPRHTLLVFILLNGLLLGGCAAPPTVKDTPQSTEQTFAKLLARVQNNPADGNYTALRITFTNTERYDPYLGLENVLNTPMFAALQEGDNHKALQLARQLLDENFVSLDAHYVAWQTLQVMGVIELAARHRQFLDGLLDSIAASGDGLTAQTAYQVISNREMYAFLGLHGLEPRGQALLYADPKTLNRVLVSDADGNRKDMYFDISIQVERGIMPPQN